MHTISGNGRGTGTISDGQNGGTSYAAAEGTTFLDGKVQILSRSFVTGGGSSGNGSASIRMTDFGDRRFKRNGKNAFDTAYEDTEGVNHFATVKISASNKVYDGQPNLATVTVVETDGDMGAVLANTTITYSNNNGPVTQPINASTDETMYPKDTCGSYVATATTNLRGYTITYVYENTRPGVTYSGTGRPHSGTGHAVACAC